MVFSFFEGQVDGFNGDKPVGEDLFNGRKCNTFAVISVHHGNGQYVYEETLVHDVPSLGCQLDEVIEVCGSCKKRST